MRHLIPVVFFSAIGLVSLAVLAGAVRFGKFSAGVIEEITQQQSKSWLLAGADLLSSFVMSLGALMALSPFALHEWIHGGHERYVWIISGPWPYNSFGGGPTQAAMYAGLFVAGLLVVGTGLLGRWQFWRRIRQETR